MIIWPKVQKSQKYSRLANKEKQVYRRDDMVVSEEISVGSFTRLGSPWLYECVAQYCSRSVVSGGLKGFSRICSDVVVEPR